MRSLGLILLFALVSGHAYGRLGETPEQMAQRFGEPHSDLIEQMPFGNLSPCVSRVYIKNGFYCYTYFLNDKVVCEGYAKQYNAEFATDEIKQLLASEASGGSWTENAKPERTTWQRSDNAAGAQYPVGHHGCLLISTPQFDKLLTTAVGAAKKKSLDGF